MSMTYSKYILNAIYANVCVPSSINSKNYYRTDSLLSFLTKARIASVLFLDSKRDLYCQNIDKIHQHHGINPLLGLCGFQSPVQKIILILIKL